VKYLDEYRDGKKVHQLISEIKKSVTKPWTIMEVCGGQTHSIIRYGLDKLLPDEINLVHGPGCPVCVTPLELIDKALCLASDPNVIFMTYADMLRVPGSFIKTEDGLQAKDLFTVKSQGGDVRIVYSPLDALKTALANPGKTVVFFAIGFETTAPANAMLVKQAQMQKIKNLCVLVSHVTVPPAIKAVMTSPETKVNGFLAAGHVCTIMGSKEYLPLASQFKIPIVITGFEPVDVSYGILKLVRQLEKGQYKIENAYKRTVPSSGNLAAQKIIKDVFEVCDRAWRGIGIIPKSGYKLKAKYAQFDAEKRFTEISIICSRECSQCLSGKVLQGLIKPNQCPAFGKECAPLTPLGATMVSSEGACAAYYKYGNYKKQKN